MKVTPRKSRQVVNKFVKGSTPIAGVTLMDVAKKLRRDNRGGSVQLMTCLLQKKVKGNLLFEYQEGGQTFYEPVEARRRRLAIPKGARRSAVINANTMVQAVAA